MISKKNKVNSKEKEAIKNNKTKETEERNETFSSQPFYRRTLH